MGLFGESLMPLVDTRLNELKDLISKLDKDRSWLLEQIDRGSWPELRNELATLERELGQLLIRANDHLED